MIRSSSSAPGGLTRRDALFALALFGAAGLLYSLFHAPLCSEQDQARLVVQAALGWERGEWPDQSYPLRTSPLALGGLRWALTSGASIRALPSVQNAVNAVAGAGVVALLFLLWRRIASPAGARAGALLLLLNPALWVGATGGMPHVPALAAFVGALHLYLTSVDAIGGRRLVALAGAALLMAVACALKVDVGLGSLALVGLLIVRRVPLGAGTLLTAALLPAAGMVTTLLLPRLLAPELASSGAFATHWSAGFPLSLRQWFAADQLLVQVRTFGWLVALGMPLVLVLAWRRPELRRLMVLALLWAVPAVLFWGSRHGNSARHMMASAAPMILLVGEVIARSQSARRSVVFVSTLLGLNLLCSQPSASTFSPSARVFTSALRIHHKVRRLHARGAAFARAGAPRRAYVQAWSAPYAAFETIAYADAVELDEYPPVWVVRHGEHVSRVRFDARRSDAEALRRAGWTPWFPGELRSSL